MNVAILTWNVFHGRDFPPDPKLRTKRSRLWRITERNATHAQVNRDLTREFATVIAAADWDIAMLQECPPRWQGLLERECQAISHRTLTSRNSLPVLRRIGAALNPDLIGSNEGGSNLTLVRGEIAERRELILTPGPNPERRTMAFARLASGCCVANLHASAGPALRQRTEADLLAGAEAAVDWAAGRPLIFGGDLNVRPRSSAVFGRLASEHGLTGPTAPDSLDHLLVRGLEKLEAPAGWDPERREVTLRDGLRVRLSDHAPVSAVFGMPNSAAGS
jgi:endonuclease/exonuclease/phosphatase family metal-dependent hydrolase